MYGEFFMKPYLACLFQYRSIEILFVDTLCKLGQHCQTATLNSAATYDNDHDTHMKDPTWNLSQPPTLIYFWISAWVVLPGCHISTKYAKW